MVDTGCPDLAHSPAASGLRGSEGQGSAYVDEGDAAANWTVQSGVRHPSHGPLRTRSMASAAAPIAEMQAEPYQVVRGPLAGHAGIPTESQEHGLSTLARGAPSLPALEPHNAAAGQNFVTNVPSFLQGQPVPLPAHLAAAESCAVAAVDLASLLTPGAATGPQHVLVHRSAAMAAAGAAGPAGPRSSPSADYPHYTCPEAGGSPAARATSGQPRTTSPAKAWPSSAAGQVALPFLPGSLLQWSQQAGPALGQAGSSKAVELLPLELAPQTRLPAAPRQQAGSTASFCPVTAAPALQELAALPMPASTALTATAQTGSNLHGVAVAAAAPAASLFANELPGPQQPIPVYEATLQHASSHVGMIDSRQFPTQSLEALDNLAWGQRYAPAPAGSVAVLPGQLGEQPTTHVQTGSTRHEHHWEQAQHPDPSAPGPAPYLAGTTGVYLPAGSVHTSGQAAPAPSLSGAEPLHSQHVLLWHASVHASNLGPQVSAASLTGQEEEGGDNGGVGESQAVAAGEAVAGFSPQVPPAASAQASPCRPDAQHSQGAWQLQDAASRGPGWREVQPEWLPAAPDHQHHHQHHHHHHHHQGPVLSCEAQLGQGTDSGLPGSPLRSEAAAEWPDTAEHASRQAAATSAPGPSLAHLGSGHHHHHHRQPCGPAAQHCMHSQPVRMVLDGPGPLNSPVPADHSSLPGSRSLAAPTAHPHALHAHRHHRPVVSGARAAASRAQPASGGLADRGSVLSGMAANGCDSAGRGLLALAEAESTPRSRGQHPATAGSGMTAAAGPVPAKSPSHGPGHMVGPPGSQQQQGMDMLPGHGGRGRARKRDVQVGRGQSGPSAVSSDPVALRGAVVEAGALGGAGAGEGAPMGLLCSAGPDQATHACKPSSGGSVDAMDMEGASSDCRTSGAGCQPSQVGLAAPQLADSQLAHKPSESGRSSQASEDGEVENSCRGPQRQQSVQWAAQSAAGQRPGRLEQRPGASGTAMPGMLGSPELHGSHRHELGIPTPSGTAQASCPMHDSMAHSRRLAEPQCSGEGQGRGYSPADRTAFRLASQWLPGHGVAAVGAAGTARLDAGIAAAARGLGNSSQAVGKPSFTVPAHQLPPAKPVPQETELQGPSLCLAAEAVVADSVCDNAATLQAGDDTQAQSLLHPWPGQHPHLHAMRRHIAAGCTTNGRAHAPPRLPPATASTHPAPSMSGAGSAHLAEGPASPAAAGPHMHGSSHQLASHRWQAPGSHAIPRPQGGFKKPSHSIDHAQTGNSSAAGQQAPLHTPLSRRTGQLRHAHQAAAQARAQGVVQTLLETPQASMVQGLPTEEHQNAGLMQPTSTPGQPQPCPAASTSSQRATHSQGDSPVRGPADSSTAASREGGLHEEGMDNHACPSDAHNDGVHVRSSPRFSPALSDTGYQHGGPSRPQRHGSTVSGTHSSRKRARELPVNS
ncbi:hypothetical protein V8C86DRAFT_2738890 [Haematococcus lacustris]